MPAFDLQDFPVPADLAPEDSAGLLILASPGSPEAPLPDGVVLGAGTGHNMANWWTGEVYDLHDDIAPAAAHVQRV